MKKQTYRKYDPTTWVEGGRLSEQFTPKPEVLTPDDLAYISELSQGATDNASVRQQKAIDASRAQMLANDYDPDDMGLVGLDSYVSPRVQAVLDASRDDDDNGDPISGMMK